MPKKSNSLIHRFLFEASNFTVERPEGKCLSPDFNADVYKAYREEMRTLPKFFIAHNALKTFSQSNYDMVIGMIRDGVIGLPRDNIIIEPEANPKSTARYFYVYKLIDLVNENSNSKLAGVFYECTIHGFDTKVNEGFSFPLAFPVDLSKGCTVLIPGVSNAPWFGTNMSEHTIRTCLSEYAGPPNKDGTSNNFLISGVRLALTAFLALYVTRGIETREVVYSIEDNKKRKRMNLGPCVTHTVMSLDTRIEYLSDKSYKDKDGKLRMRLHWRCGHKKKQAHGPGRTLRKDIWIMPYLVGCDERGKVTHDYSFEGKKGYKNDSSECANAPLVATAKTV